MNKEAHDLLNKAYEQGYLSGLDFSKVMQDMLFLKMDM